MRSCLDTCNTPHCVSRLFTIYMDPPNNMDTFCSGNESYPYKLKYSTLGNTNLKLSRLGVGGASLGKHYG